MDKIELSTEGLARSFRDPLTTAVPITDLRKFLPDESIYDEYLSARDIIEANGDPERIAELRNSVRKELNAKRVRSYLPVLLVVGFALLILVAVPLIIRKTNYKSNL